MAGLRIVARTASAPTLLYISALNTGSEGAEWIRQAMNTALQQLPYVSETLGLIEVLPASEDDYLVVLDSSSYAEDIAADTFAQLLSAGQGTVIREPRALLTTIVQRLFYQLWRRCKVEQAYLRRVLHDEPPLSPSPEALVQVHQALQAIDVLLEGLPDKVRTTFVLSRVNGLTYPEIALKLGISSVL